MRSTATTRAVGTSPARTGPSSLSATPSTLRPTAVWPRSVAVRSSRRTEGLSAASSASRRAPCSAGASYRPLPKDYSMRVRLLVLGCLLSAGCAGSNVAPVSGTVTLNGKPLAHATVVFQPESAGKNPGPGSSGTTDEKGRYTLRVMTTKAPGALVGKHKVSITADEGDREGESSAPSSTNKVIRKALVPPEYNVQTKLTFDVPAGGSTSADFDLKSPPANTR